jgi:cathepsin F
VHFLATGNLTSLSEEQMIGCDPETHGEGCHGGEPFLALEYVAKTGLTSEQSYPFSDGSGPDHTHCDTTKIRAPLARISKWAQVSSYPHTNEEGLAAALTRNGPLSLSLDASAMHHYAGGVDDPVTRGPDAACQAVHVNHAVLLVGYGVEKGVSYWRIKNSWGTTFGEAGYYRIARGSNKCGLANDVVHSIVQLCDRTSFSQ